MEPITLPGDIPGLLRRGAPVFIDDHRLDGPDVVLRMMGAEADVACTDLPHRHPWWTRLGLHRLSLDLRDEAGVDRAARWLVERTEPHVRVRVTAPRWEGIGERRWTLDGRIHFHPKWGDDSGEPMAPTGRTLHVPALASIPVDHPDADLLALRAVVLHVAGRV
jgi:hypothetical protein